MFDKRECVCFHVFMRSLCIHTVIHANCGFIHSSTENSPANRTHTYAFSHILRGGGSVAMATIRTAASASATEAEPDETKGGGGCVCCCVCETVH